MKKEKIILFFLFFITSFTYEQNIERKNSIRLETDITLGIFSTGYEIRGAYLFPITDNLSWDTGLNVRLNTPSLGLGGLLQAAAVGGYASGINAASFWSIWFKNVYLQYGIGIDIVPKCGIGFSPFDIRFGWQKKFNNKEKGWCFKLETGLFSFHTKFDSETMEETLYADFYLSLGASYKFR